MLMTSWSRAKFHTPLHGKLIHVYFYGQDNIFSLFYLGYRILLLLFLHADYTFSIGYESSLFDGAINYTNTILTT